MAKGSISVKAGQKIKKGDKLGVMGSTGASTGAHTHIELRVPGTSKTSLDISEFCGIPNKLGTYEAEEENIARLLQEKCGLSDGTMEYLLAYKWADDLIRKLWEKMK